MAEITWVKLKTEMFADEKIRLIEAMPEADSILIIWIKLLIQAGKTNANGYIFLSKDIPFTEEMFATLFNRPLQTVRLALKVLADFKMISVVQDGSVKINNWSSHQNVEGMDKVRELNRVRQERFRGKMKQLDENNVTVTLRNGTDSDIDSDIDKESKEKEKNKYAEFVLMTKKEYQKLIEKYGQEDTRLMINKLDNYKGSKGKKYKSDYRAILSWVADEVIKKNGKPKVMELKS